MVQERLGHSQISVTLDIYSRVVPGMQEKAARAFADVISRDAQKGSREGFGRHFL